MVRPVTLGTGNGVVLLASGFERSACRRVVGLRRLVGHRVTGSQTTPIDGNAPRGQRLLQHRPGHRCGSKSAVVAPLGIVDLHDDRELGVIGREQRGE